MKEHFEISVVDYTNIKGEVREMFLVNAPDYHKGLKSTGCLSMRLGRGFFDKKDGRGYLFFTHGEAARFAKEYEWVMNHQN